MDFIDLTADDPITVPSKRRKVVQTSHTSIDLPNWLKMFLKTSRTIVLSLESSEEVQLLRSLQSIIKRKVDNHTRIGSFTTEKQLQRILLYLRRTLSGVSISLDKAMQHLGISKILINQSSGNSNSYQADTSTECSICLGFLENPVTTPCAHLFCLECIKTCYPNSSSLECPLCRRKVSIGSLRPVSLDIFLDFSTEHCVRAKFDAIQRDIQENVVYCTSNIILSLFADVIPSSVMTSAVDPPMIVGLDAFPPMRWSAAKSKVRLYILEPLLTLKEVKSLHSLVTGLESKGFSVLSVQVYCLDSFEHITNSPSFQRSMFDSFQSRNYRSILTRVSS